MLEDTVEALETEAIGSVGIGSGSLYALGAWSRLDVAFVNNFTP